MQLQYFVQAALMAGAIAARKEPRQQITITLTGAVSPLPFTSFSTSTTAAGVQGGATVVVIPTIVPVIASPSSSSTSTSSTSSASSSSSSTSGALSLPPSRGSSPGTAIPPVASGSSGAANCGKGYTYCGYMLTQNGHDFAQSDVDNAYCKGLPELCATGKRKTNVAQAVFVCLEDAPSTVELVCACSGTCLNNASSNYIAHCDKPCVNN